MKNIWNNWKGQSILKKSADILGFCIIVSGIIVSILMNCVGRTLWLDEAMLAFSFSKRSLLELTNGVFEWDQSAPVLYLYCVKILTLLFGNTEAVLRSFSVFSLYCSVVFKRVCGKKAAGCQVSHSCGGFSRQYEFYFKIFQRV